MRQVDTRSSEIPEGQVVGNWCAECTRACGSGGGGYEPYTRKHIFMRSGDVRAPVRAQQVFLCQAKPSVRRIPLRPNEMRSQGDGQGKGSERGRR
jgi:hypothetical protein